MIYKASITLCIMLFFISETILSNQANNDSKHYTTESTAVISPDDPIVVMLDSLASLNVFRNLDLRRDTLPPLTDGFPADFVPEYCDSVYKARFEELNNFSPIEFEYNAIVKAFIDLYSQRRRDLTERIMGLSELYFPFFEEQLDKHNLPLELKYIAVIESALNPVARSRMGATGIWQFMYGTGRIYGLEVNSYVDDRSDVTKSTIAACEHFVDLYNIYDDWLLAIAAYNSGAGNVNRAIRRSGGVRDFWSIRGFLPRETSNYVPALMAVAYVMEYSDNHNLYPSPPPYTRLDIDTLHVNKILSLRNVSVLLDIPLDHLRYLNPSFRQNIIPGSQNKTYVLHIPKDYSGLFVANEEEIYNYKTPEEIRQEELAAQLSETTVHVVRQGEVLGTIAQRYGCSVREIQRWNNLRGTLIRPGQRLVVRAPQPATTNIVADNNVHVVRSGESLGLIANRYRVSINNLVAWNNLAKTTIYPGQHLIVRHPEGKIISETAEVKSSETIHEEKEEDITYIYHRVEQGDTLLDIANKYPGISISEIQELNNLSNNELTPGQKIKITINEQ